MRQESLIALRFSVENGNNNTHKKIKFIYDDLNKQYQNLMVVLFPLGNPPIPPIEQALIYDERKKQWRTEVERPNDAREIFILIPNTPQDELSIKEAKSATPVASGFIALKNGVQQDVNKKPGIPAGSLKQFLYTKDEKILKTVDESQLKDGERLITIYFPPGYHADRKQLYNFQVTLDGDQYLNSMQMNVIFDNLIASGEIEPVVNVFISPYTGAPDHSKPGLSPVTPPGYSLSKRFKEYSCNPEVAEKLSRLPKTVGKQFNVTADPKRTTIWGLSMGGLQAEYTALIYPDVFGNIVAQSPMAWNIPTHRGDDWREHITDDWQTSTDTLPPIQVHKEYLTQIVLGTEQIDTISGRPIAQSTTQT